MRARWFDTPRVRPYPRATPRPRSAQGPRAPGLGGSVKRWLALAVGLSVALAGLTLLATRGTTPDPREQIDARSRRSLERALVDAERESGER